MSISAVLGFGTLVGVAGFTLGYELHDRIAIGAGLGTNLEGWMGGPYVRFRPVVAWLQLEPSWETRSVSGTTFRVGLGWSVLLTPETVGCEGPITGKPCGEPIPLVGVVSFSLGVPIAG